MEGILRSVEIMANQATHIIGILVCTSRSVQGQVGWGLEEPGTVEWDGPEGPFHPNILYSSLSNLELCNRMSCRLCLEQGMTFFGFVSDK